MAILGRYEQYAGREHFIPYLLMELPEIKLTRELVTIFGEAMANLGRVEALTKSIPFPNSLIRAYVTKEALLSSEIEGTIATLTEVMEAVSRKKGNETRDVRDVLNYIDATDTALNLLNVKRLPLAGRLIKSAHRVLLSSSAGESKTPGEYRESSVMVGHHVPPPAPYIPELMRDLEEFLNTNTYPPLIKAGLGHVQFETIHPFLDGNGRIGRLLIVLGLVNDGLLSVPLLYPSYYFKRFRSEYYAYLDGVRLKGDWLSWLKFYLRAINETATDTISRMDLLIKVIGIYKKQLENFALRDSDVLLNAMLVTPVFNITQLAKDTGYTFAGANKIVKKLEQVGIVKQRGSGKRSKTYRLEEYMQILEADTSF